MTSLLVEGWRGINHSYAMVNQYQLLELQDLGFKLFHRDLPLHQPHWSAERSPSGFDAARARRIAAIPSPDEGEFSVDAVYRISFPYRYYAPKQGRLFVFGTSEFQHIDRFVYEDSLKEGLRNPALKVITPSQWSKIGFLKAGFDESRVAVVPHGVDSSVFAPLEAERRRQIRARVGLADGDFAVLFVGSMALSKGPDVLVRAYAVLRRKYPHLRLILKESAQLYSERLADVLNEVARVHSGLVTDDLRASITVISETLTLEQLRELYGAADCYASPYRAEGFNVPPLEAAACGVPVVITKGGATDDYAHESFALPVEGTIVKHPLGTFIEPNLDSLIAQLTALIEDRAHSIDRSAAIAFIAENFSWRAAARKLADVLAR